MSEENTSPTVLGLPLPEKWRKSRVVQECAHLMGQIYGETIGALLLRVFLDLLIVWCLLLLAHYIVQLCMPVSSCAACCYTRNSASCCLSSLSFMLKSLVLIVVFFIGSFLSTALASTRRFQHSVLLNASVLFSVFLYLWCVAFPRVVILPLLVIAFFMVFWGYRASLRFQARRRKAKSSPDSTKAG